MNVKIVALHFVSSLLGFISPNAAAGAAKPLAIVHAVVVDGNGGNPIENGVVVVRDGRIEAIGRGRDVAVPRDAKVIDARGGTVMPALADMHVHLVGGWDGQTPDFLGYQRYLDALLYAGVTTALDIGNVQPFVLQLRQELSAGRLTGPRLYVAGALIDGADPMWPPLSYSISSLAQVPALVQRQKRDGVDVVKAYVGLSDLAMKRLVQEANKQSLRVFVDQWSRNGSIDLMREGIAAFAHLPTSLLSDDAVQLMSDNRIACITTLTASESFSRRRLGDLRFLDEPLLADVSPPWFVEALRREAARRLDAEEGATAAMMGERLAAAQRNAKRLVDAGILLVAGTDAPSAGVSQGEGLHRELEPLVEAGLTPLQAIGAATRNAAALMQASAEWGTLEPGKRADLLLVDGRPDRNINDTRRIRLVLQQGRIVHRQTLRFDPRHDRGFRPAASISS